MPPLPCAIGHRNKIMFPNVIVAALALLLAAVPAPADAEAAYPVISTSGCASDCAGLPAALSAACTACLYPAMNAWDIEPGLSLRAQLVAISGISLTTPLKYVCSVMNIARASGSIAVADLTASYRPLQRLPLYEAGYVNTPALPLLRPTRWSTGSQGLGAPDATTLSFVKNLNTINFPFCTTPLTVCLKPAPSAAQPCLNTPVTRPAGSTTTNPLTSCVKQQGWMSPRGAAAQGCGLLSPTPLTLLNVTFDQPEALASMFPTTRGRQAPMAGLQGDARSMLTKVQAAQDSLWAVSQQVLATTLLIKSVPPSRIPALKTIYGADWNTTWEALAAAGNLAEFDVSYLSGFKAAPRPASSMLAAHALLAYVGSPHGQAGVKMRVVATALGSQAASNFALTNVYTPSKSASAFIGAMTVLRSVFMQQLIWGGHVYHMHVLQGAVGYALYNSIDAKLPPGLSAHPVRALLDPYIDPSYPQEFIAAMFGGIAPPPPTPISQDTLPEFFELYARAGPFGAATLHSCHPLQLLNWSGLDAARFTKASAWDQYPVVGLQLQILNQCTTSAGAALAPYYPTDAAVANDAGVQAWVQAMLAPSGANLRQINAGNKITTRQELFNLAGYMLFISVAHGTTHLQDYASATLSQAHLPVSINGPLPAPTGQLSLDQQVALATTSDTYSNQASFIYAFIGSQTWTTFVPGTLNIDSGKATPNYSGLLPFFNPDPANAAAAAAAAAANDAVVTFRKQISKLLKSNTAVRASNTNWGYPMAMPSAIEL